MCVGVCVFDCMVCEFICVLWVYICSVQYRYMCDVTVCDVWVYVYVVGVDV